MKTRLTLIFLLFSYVLSHGQEVIDTSFLRCSYRLHSLSDTIEKKKFPEQVFILQVGENSSKYYSFHTAVFDSIAGDKEGSRKMRESVNMMLQKYEITGKIDQSNLGYKRGSSQIIYKNYSKGGMTVSEEILNTHFTYMDSLNMQTWDITDSVKTVLGYECQKATSYFRGRHWIAWFTPEIPVNDGPWKLMGLPGLIMEAYDKNRHYDYLISGLEYYKSPIVYEFKKSIPSTWGDESILKQQKSSRHEFYKTKMTYLKDRIAYINMVCGVPNSKGYVMNKFPVMYDFEELDYK